MARIHYLQHVTFEGPANIAKWAEAREHELIGMRLYAGESLPDVVELDWLVIMGGPMGANDDREHHWMRPRVAFRAARAFRAGKEREQRSFAIVAKPRSS